MFQLLSVPGKTALVYQPNSYVRRGPPETCVQIVSGYESAGFETELMLVRTRVPAPSRIAVTSSLPRFLGTAPWSTIRGFGISRLDRLFIRRLRQLDPERTIVDVWPGWPSPILTEARRLGFITVRNMINCACALSKQVLDRAYARQGMAPTHGVTDALVRAESEELRHYDYIMSPSVEVDRSLSLIGIPHARVLRSSFGWDPARFSDATAATKSEGRLRFLFVGSVGVRKGVPELLEAWARARPSNAELLIVGDVEAAYRKRFDAGMSEGITHLPFTADLGGIYKSSDVFVFPSHEEGAPQVVYEAAGCGAAVITTPMGTGRMVHDGVNGLVLPPGDVGSLVAALTRMADDAALRERLRRQAAQDARRFEYAQVGRTRAQMLAGLLQTEARRAIVA